jgi:hypothetical protein
MRAYMLLPVGCAVLRHEEKSHPLSDKRSLDSAYI